MFVHKVLFEFLEFMHPRLLLISPAIRLHRWGGEGGGSARFEINITQDSQVKLKVSLLFVKLVTVLFRDPSTTYIKQIQKLNLSTLTKPCFFNFLASSLLMCHSMEVSPQLINLQCQPVNTPRASVTAEHNMNTYITLLCSDSEALSPLW